MSVASRKELCNHPIIDKFAKKFQEIEDAYYKSKGRALRIEYHTEPCGFYINYGKFHGTFAIGKKTHPEQFMFSTKRQAQIQGCTEFLEYLEKL